ncbi:MAG: hypothetical protein ABIN89_13275 [Chitinophagaceae bacterium]
MKEKELFDVGLCSLPGYCFKRSHTILLVLCFLVTITGINSVTAQQVNNDVLEVGSQRQLFVDDFLVDKLLGKAELRLHNPTPQNIVLETNEPWEGNGTNYVTVFMDESKYRMYYRACHYSYLGGKDRPNSRDIYCYAESTDGIHWIKPELGIISWNGSKKNNIIIDGVGGHAFSPFKDANPQCKRDARYKALGYGRSSKHGLYAFKSADGIHWQLMDTLPVITKGAFDSQNLAFWDARRSQYRGYHRDFRGKDDVDLINAGADEGRDIRTETSDDFLHWTEPVFLDYSAIVDPGIKKDIMVTVSNTQVNKVPSERVSELYTNQIMPYYRAPDLLIGFPTRYADRGWTESAKALPRYDYRQVRAKESRREGTAVTEGMIISSHDRKHFSVWPESFLRPGLRNSNTWFYGDMYQNWGLVETKSMIVDAPPEISLYATERALQEKGVILRRYTLRLDGFVSVNAPLAGGEVVTKLIKFTGSKLMLNLSTSAAGSVRVEIQNADGQALPGFSLGDCPEIYGDDLERAVVWKGNADLAGISGKAVRVRFVVSDADVYSFIFK